jgi:hypothetical protein
MEYPNNGCLIRETPTNHAYFIVIWNCGYNGGFMIYIYIIYILGFNGDLTMELIMVSGLILIVG